MFVLQSAKTNQPSSAIPHENSNTEPQKNYIKLTRLIVPRYVRQFRSDGGTSQAALFPVAWKKDEPRAVGTFGAVAKNDRHDCRGTGGGGGTRDRSAARLDG